MSEQQTDESITLFADYVCPFCYLGRQSLDRYQEGREEELRVDWHPFDLRAQKRGPDGEIDHSVEDGKDEDYYEQARENVRRLQDEYGVEMAQELITDVDSLNAQVASYYVKEHYDYEQWRAFDDGIYEALWQEGRDIGDPDVLADIAEAADVPPAEVRDAVDDENLREDVEALFDHARQRGVTGVPTFAYEGHAARGAVPPEHIERLVEGE
ncbi:DsbA family oxidoreductase [Halomicrobium salinisoli]|uniref:DsbA family oxidoreductase n=1 Tax=Halomicrobium salinisoli TaxID=2878391 RepID=UPI001CF08A44|nr:DsbA family oxidoreductase [Halomicrobium salinisoli]